MKLLTVTCDTNYGPTVVSKVLVNDEELKDYQALVGRTIDFGELEGKHTEVYGMIVESGLKVVEMPEEEAIILEKHLGKRISGEDLFAYCHPEEEFEELFDRLLESLDAMVLMEFKQKAADFYERKDPLNEVPIYFVKLLTVSKVPFYKLAEWDKEYQENLGEDEPLSKEVVEGIVETLNQYL